MEYDLVQKGPERDKSQLFTMGQAVKAVGLSRSTVMRMEKRGLLVPAYVSPSSGNRYYDLYNIMRIMMVERLHDMGFTYEEAQQYFSAGADARDLLDLVEERLRLLQWTYEEMTLRAKTESHLSVRLGRMAGGWYYTEHSQGVSPQDKYNAAYDAYHHCVEKGYRLSNGPLMTVNHRTDYLEGRIDTEPHEFDAYIPIQPGQDAPETVCVPDYLALTLFYCGDFSELDEAYLRLGREVRLRGLKPEGYVRMDTVVGPPLGREVGLDKYRCRLILPVRGEIQESSILTDFTPRP